jgi:hypothetical protein
MNKSDPKYVRLGPPPVGDDLRLYDGGNLYFAVIGCTGAGTIGTLEITYDFELTMPTLLNQGAGGIAETSSVMFQAAETGGASTVDYQVKWAFSQTGNPTFVNTAGSIVPPAGNYLATFRVQFNAGAQEYTHVTAVLYKNGVAVANQGPTAIDTNTFWVQELNQTLIVSANGTDAFTVLANATYGGATNLVSGEIVFVPI